MSQPTDETVLHRPVEETVERRGWLPIRTNAVDRWFISIVLLIAIHLLWMRFLEAHLSLYLATAISLVVGWAVVRRG